VRQSRGLNWLGVFSGVCLLVGTGLLVVELVAYSRTFATYPPGLSLGGAPVGGLTEAAALEQLVTAYNSPLELRYRDSLILLAPEVVGFQVESAQMLSEAARYQTNENFWSGFWDFLWLQPRESAQIPLKVTYSPEKLQSFLEDLAARYDRPGSPPRANVGTLGFVPGEPGHALDLTAAFNAIDAALHSAENRVVTLPVNEQTAIRPSLETLGDLIRDDVSVHQFPGVFSLYLMDLQTGRELEINLFNQTDISGPVAFSAMSTIKIPVMVTFFAQNVGDLTDDEKLLLQRSIDESANTATDLLIRTVGRGDERRGTQTIVEDMRGLGLNNTYLSGLLDVAGAVYSPLGTPANSRTDISTSPDPYNQTTAEDMGTLMVMIYQCSRGGGALMAAFPGEFMPEECRTMIDLLTRNEVGPIFITGGSLPNGVVAHKHGWDRVPLNNVGDSAIVFTPGGDYAMTLYAHHPETMGFEEANRMIISISTAVYNYFNPSGS